MVRSPERRKGRSPKPAGQEFAPPVTDHPFSHRNWQSSDGLTLHFRDYPGSDDRAPVLCLHGLTRNARDFEALAPHIAARNGRRVLVPEMRGRGRSAYAPDPASYAVPTYVADVAALLAQESIDRCLPIGTSMGGLILLGLASIDAVEITGFVLNDVGPVLEAEGIARIKQYVGQGGSFPTWVHAARALAQLHGETYPGYQLADWLAMAKRMMVLVSNGRVAFDYDMRIAEPILAEDANAEAPDAWPLLGKLAGCPAVLVRGALSKLISPQTFAQMAMTLPQARTVVVPGVGHAPTLDEPEARAALDPLLVEAG
jgi:pimeloyl-ACP methyl ester carboxylesterase